MVDDWLAHTPKDVVAKNFGVNSSVFANTPTADPYILNATVSTQQQVSGGNGELNGQSSFVYRTLQQPGVPVPGGAGTFRKIDSTNFPVAKTIAAAVVTLNPNGLRELHWHPNVSPFIPLVHCTMTIPYRMPFKYEEVLTPLSYRPKSGFISIKALQKPQRSSEIPLHEPLMSVQVMC
jgi:hypothetical protein